MYPASGSQSWNRVSGALKGRYEYEGWLGSGAFGDVYKARQKVTQQLVAIKVLRTRDHENAVKRFLREVRACGTLHHPHVVRVLEAGGDESEEYPLYTVFEYVPGQTLAARLSVEGTLRVKEAVGLMSQVLDALQAAHQLGVVHRDLKPANIMVSETGAGFHAKILDFGIAGLLEGPNGVLDVGLTQTHERLGTPAYCAPEQLRGEPPSPRVDVYAWGLVFLQCLTGRSAFGGGTLPEVLEAQFSKEPVPLPEPLSQHRLGALLRSVLEKDAARRAVSSRSLLAELLSLDVTDLVDRAGFLLGTMEAPGSDTLPPTHGSPLARTSGERRPVTAVCCRINVASLRPEQDDEALDEWLEGVRSSMIETAQRHGGALAGSAGSELLFYFGLRPGEDGITRRATTAACEIRELCQRRSSAVPVRATWDVDFRLALHQGMVSIDPLSQRERAGFGSVAAAASRLCQLVERGGIAVSHAAYGRVRDILSLEAGGDSASGRWYHSSAKPKPLPRKLELESPINTVGRNEECARLMEIWSTEGSASTPGALLMGAAGFGKTHVARAFLARLAASDVQVLEARCLPETQDLSMQPVLNLLRDRLSLAGKPPIAGSEALLAFLQAQDLENTAEAMPLLCAWLGLPSQGWPEPEYSPKKRRDLFLAWMVRIVQSLCDRPTVLFIEDVHWADPTTLEWLSILTRSSASQRPFLLGTMRGAEAEIAQSSADTKPRNEALTRLTQQLTTIELRGLKESASRELLISAWGEPAPSEAELASIVARGGGVPLFLLELARCRAEGAAIPASIAELLSARIDRLGKDVKETVQLAAVIGAEFDAQVLREVSTRGEKLPGDLNYLQASGVLASSSEGHYAFSHSLLHESAYKSMLVVERQRLHARAADALLRIDPEARETKAWPLALHSFNAGNPLQALGFGGAAAGQALLRFDNLEVVGLVRQMRGRAVGSRSWLSGVDDASARANMELQLVALETTALMMTRGWADMELNETCEQASQLFEHVPLANTLQLRYALAQFYFNRGFVIDPETNADRARPYIDGLIDAAQRTGTEVFERLGRMMLGAWELFHGNIAASLATLRAVRAFGDPRDAWRFGFDAYVGARSVECLARWFQGDPQVREFAEQVIEEARQTKHPATLAIAWLYQASVYQLFQDRPRTASICVEILALSEKYGLQGYPGYALILKGWADDDPNLADQALAMLGQAGQHLTHAFYGGMLATAEMRCGNLEQAFLRLERLVVHAEDTREMFALPDLLCSQAICGEKLGVARPQCDTWFARGLALALEQRALGAAASIASRYALALAEADPSARAERLTVIGRTIAGEDDAGHAAIRLLASAQQESQPNGPRRDANPR